MNFQHALRRRVSGLALGYLVAGAGLLQAQSHTYVNNENYTSNLNTLDNIVLKVPTGASAIQSGRIFGSDSVTFNPAQVNGGKLTLTGDNNYTGNTKINFGTVEISGVDATISSTQNLYVGFDDRDNANVVVSNGGLLRSIATEVAFLGGSGSVTVTGAGSNWTTYNALEIGVHGQGNVTVASGGEVFGTETILGFEGAGGGSVTVTGSGSTWNTNNFAVGYNGTGTLRIENGGSVVDTDGEIGVHSSGATGTATVTGAGSTWSNSVILIVGYAGQGALTVSDGGLVTAPSGYLGYYSGTTGTATITGAGSAINITNDFIVGLDGTGSLTISKGGQLKDESGYISYRANSAGTVTVQDPGSSWDSSGSLVVGFGNAGSLTISNLATVSAFVVALGFEGAGKGTINLNSGGVLTTQRVYVDAGPGGGTLNFNGGTLRASMDGPHFLDGFTGTRMALLSGGGTIDNNGHEIMIASPFSGTGALTFTGSGQTTLTSTNTHTGSTTIRDGQVKIASGGSLGSASASAYVGLNSGDNASLIVKGGSKLTAGVGWIGYNAGSTGAATVVGAGSDWSAGGGLYVGYRGAGAFTLDDNATASASFVRLANQGSSSGTLDLKDGAVLSTGQIARGNGTGGAQINFDGGILKATGSSAGFIQSFTGTQVSLLGGGLLLDNNGFTLSIGSPLTGVGGLTVKGAGTTTFTGANSYGGGTEIKSGTLAVLGTNATLGTTSSEVRVGSTSGDNGSLTVSSGAKVYASTSNVGYASGSIGSVTVSGTGSTLNTTDYLLVGNDGTGSLSISSRGTVTDVRADIGSGAGSTGTVTVTGLGSSWTHNGADLVVGRSGNGVLTVSAGATVSDRDGYIGHNSTATGNVTVTGINSKWSNSGDVYLGNGGTGTLAIASSGAVSAISVQMANSGTATGTLNVTSGGTLSTGQIVEGGGSGGAKINLNGGILKATTDSADFISGFEPGDMTLGSGGGTINTNGHALTIGTVLGGMGGLTKASTGTLTLTGANTWSGTTTISGGTLVVNGSLANSGLAVNNSATLAGSGSVAGIVTVASGGTLSPGNSPGTLTLGNLTLSNGSILNYELGAPGTVGGGVNDLIVVSNNLTLDGVLNLNTLTNFGAGTYTLFTYGGALTNNGLTFGVSPGGYDLAVNAGSGLVTLSVSTSSLQYWNGATTSADGTIHGGTGIWDAGTTNWTNAGGNASAAWLGNTAVFSGTAGTVTVSGTQSIAGLQFTTNGYALNGGTLDLGSTGADIRVDSGLGATVNSILSGNGGVTKNGAGTVVLGGTNAYLGGTTINSGTVSISSNANLGATSGSVTFKGGTLQNTSAISSARVINLTGNGTFQTDAALTLSGAVSGNGNLTKTGTSSLTLTGSNPYVGDTTISAGTVLAGNNASFGTGTVTISDGAGFGSAKSSVLTLANDFLLSGAIGVTRTSNATVSLSGTTTLSGDATLSLLNNASLILKDIQAITSGTNLTLSGTSTGSYRMAGSNQLDLTTVTNGVNLTLFNTSRNNTTILHDLTIQNGGSVREAGRDQLGAEATITIESGGTFFAFEDTINHLQGGGTLTNGPLDTPVNLTVNQGDFSGQITDFDSNGTTALTKDTSGTLVLSGSNSYSGGTTLLDGVLSIKADNNLGDSSGGVTFNGGTLQTAGSITSSRNVTLTGPGTIQTDADESLSGNLVLTGTIAGSGSLIKTGEETLTLSGDNTYGGGTTIGAGMIVVGGDHVLGTGRVTISDGAVLGYNTTVVLANDFSMNGEIGFRNQSLGGSVTLTGTTTLTGSTSVTSLLNAIVIFKDIQATDPVATLALGGSTVHGYEITGCDSVALTTVGASTLLALNNASADHSTILHDLTIHNAGSVFSLADNQLGATSTLTIEAGGSFLQLAGTRETIHNLQGAGSLSNDSGSPATFTIHQGSFNGVIEQGSSAIGVTKDTAGALALYGANTYTGPTTILQGSVILGVVDAIASASQIRLAGGTLDANGLSPIPFTQALTVDGAGSTLDFGLDHIGSVTLQFGDSSAVTWTMPLSLIHFTVGTDALGFGSDMSGLTSDQLAAISLSGYTATGLDLNGFVEFEPAAVPEPTIALLMPVVVGAIGVCLWRRRLLNS